MDVDLTVLKRTPDVLESLLKGLPASWTSAEREEGEAWSPHEILGHLIHGERTDWIPRVRIILEGGGEGRFEPFDRLGHRAWCEGRSVDDLLEEFRRRRRENLATLQEMRLTDTDLGREGVHPELGKVTLRQLLSTWVAHDLAHVAQTARAMTVHLEADVGPWSAYFRTMG